MSNVATQGKEKAEKSADALKRFNTGLNNQRRSVPNPATQPRMNNHRANTLTQP